MKRPLVDNLDDASDDTCFDEDFLDMEEAAIAEATNVNVRACKALGVNPAFVKEWAEGVVFDGAEHAQAYFCDNYSSLKRNANTAAGGLGRLASHRTHTHTHTPRLISAIIIRA